MEDSGRGKIKVYQAKLTTAVIIPRCAYAKALAQAWRGQGVEQ